MSETNENACPHCGADHWRISATLIQCAACEAEWGRVDGAWIEVPRGVAGDRCEYGNECGRLGCPECQG